MSMDVTFKDQSLDRLEVDASYSGGFGNVVVRAFRKAMQHIRAATDERTLYARRSFRFEKLHGQREGQHSMRLNDQWRLIIELRTQGTRKTIHVIEIADYH
jgi:proteic killer suppression protein